MTMDTLHRVEVAPPLIEHLERLVTEDELAEFDEECSAHDGCRDILSRRIV